MSLLMDQERFEDLCAGYVLNALDEDDRRTFEQALATATPDMRLTLAQMQRAARHLSAAAEQQEPPAYLRARILSAVAARSPSQNPAGLLDRLADLLGLSTPRVAVTVAFGLLLAAGGIGGYTLSLRNTARTLAVTVLQQQQQLAELTGELEKKEVLLSVLAARTVEMVLMNGLEVNPNGYGKVIWDPARRAAILQVSNLPTIPTDRDYQLWVIRNQVPISAGVFAIRQGVQEAFFRIENLAETDRRSINAFAITLEPAGGVLQPTGPMYLLGSPL